MKKKATAPAQRAWWHRLRRPRLTVSLLLGVIVYVALLTFTGLPWRLRFITAWDIGVTSALVAISLGLRDVPLDVIKYNAMRQDSGKGAVLILALLASVASLVVIASEMPVVKTSAGLEQAARVLFIIYTVLVSWAFVQTVFGLHYAHEYYVGVDTSSSRLSPQGQRLLFPGSTMPRYHDFMYFSFTIGMTFQVSDVQIADTRLRQLTLLHAVTAFFYSTGIVALAINLVAGLI